MSYAKDTNVNYLFDNSNYYFCLILINYYLQLQMSKVFKTFIKTNYLKHKMASIYGQLRYFITVVALFSVKSFIFDL